MGTHPMPSSPFSAVRFFRAQSRNRAIFAYFGGRKADFLCSADCMAEGKGFEPSVQVLARTTVWQIQPVPYLLHGINQLRSAQVPLVGQNQGARHLCMHLNMHLRQG